MQWVLELMGDRGGGGERGSWRRQTPGVTASSRDARSRVQFFWQTIVIMILVEPLVCRPILQYAISMSKFRIRREKTEKLIRVEKYQRKAAAVGVQGIIYQVNILYQGGNLPG